MPGGRPRKTLDDLPNESKTVPPWDLEEKQRRQRQRFELDDPREVRLERIEDKLDMIWDWLRVFERDREDRRYEKILERVKL